ncbi:anti-sigma-F factor Fin family protein [Bacillus sp. JCM 19041]|uniref:anti-sigma-F factor Fin family protein n=1 Tax=Bacillus sp. JCM 19041 TaxID=1460637 RepID=UPI0006D1881D
MAIHYGCRHCQKTLGMVSNQVTHEELGLHNLTSEERDELLTYMENGSIHVKVVCEDCYAALENNPQLYGVSHIIQ